MIPFYTRAISEHFRDKGLIIKPYINGCLHFPFTLKHPYTMQNKINLQKPLFKKLSNSRVSLYSALTLSTGCSKRELPSLSCVSSFA